ncbi:MAG TPA: TFIIB-type zinc finger domain-containing protein [Solirubrobacteraceae bacterium]|nr:TFIIB-type zinc finger domain-containing protein [Solirubrobacteraceae bacterium]
MATVLVELPGGEGIVRRDDGEIVLTHDVTLDWGQPLQPWDRYQPLRIGLGDERMLFGGLLPPGAVSAEAVEATGARRAAVVGGGTYAVIVEDGEPSEPALGYRDAEGAFVSRPMPAEYRHQPVTDAEEPCPVCGAIEYEEYFPTEDWRGGRGRKGSDSFVPSPLIVCRRCGHQEQVGAIMRLGHDDADEDAAARAARMARIRAEQDVQRWYSNKMTLMGVTFPIYAAEGWPARINGQSSSGDDLTSLTIAHADSLPDSMFVERPRIEVTTSIESHQRGELAVARDGFAAQIEADANRRPTGDLSDAALTLWFRAARRDRVAGSHKAPVGETEITIDGTPEPFVIVGAPNAHWVAVRRHDDLTITIAAREVDPSSLIIEPIADPAARLLGPEPGEP